jgi:hypothetical protein
MVLHAIENAGVDCTRLLAADTPKHSLGVASGVRARNDDQKTRLQAVEDLEGEPSHETAVHTPVDGLARFWEVKQRRKHSIDCVHELRTQPDAFGFVPFESSGDVVFHRIEDPDRASRLSRQVAP